MFNPSRDEARRFFCDAWHKYRGKAALSPLESMAVEIVALHPEYHALLEQPERHLDKDYAPEDGVINPFLHLSLHLAVAEQLGIDQPPGLRAQFERLCTKLDKHAARHALIECLGETIWQAQRNGSTPDQQYYLDCLKRK
ncbi:MAG: DUF1841 family protein [Pseudomonadota bacterium]